MQYVLVLINLHITSLLVNSEPMALMSYLRNRLLAAGSVCFLDDSQNSDSLSFVERDAN